MPEDIRYSGDSDFWPSLIQQAENENGSEEFKHTFTAHVILNCKHTKDSTHINLYEYSPVELWDAMSDLFTHLVATGDVSSYMDFGLMKITIEEIED